MSASDVLHVLTCLERAGVAAWLDGGWGVDALVGEETRPHDDLDLVIALEASDRTQEAMSALGFSLSEDERPTRFVMRDSCDRRIDFHTVVFDQYRGGIQHLQDGTSYRYPPEGFTGSGLVDGRPMCCLTPEVQVECHLGYAPDGNDYHDMRLLHVHFGIALPPPYDGI